MELLQLFKIAASDSGKRLNQLSLARKRLQNIADDLSNNVPADKVMYFSPKLHQNNYKNNQVELKTDAKECHYCSHGQGLASSVLAPSHDIHLHDHNVDPWPWCGLALIFIQQTV